VFGDGLPFVANAMDGNDPSTSHEKPEHSRIELTYMPQLKQFIAQSLAQRWTVILRVAKFASPANTAA